MPISANQFGRFIEFAASSCTVFISLLYLEDRARGQRAAYFRWPEFLCYLGLALLGLILVGVSLRVLSGGDPVRRRLIVACIALGATASIVIDFLDHTRPSLVFATYFVPQLLLFCGNANPEKAADPGNTGT